MSDLPILYSFRRCPYAMRARMALWVSGIKVTLREVVLSDKPPELLAISRKATVPVLVLSNGRVIDESLDIMRWALERSDPLGWLQGNRLNSSWILECDGDFKNKLDRYKYADRYPEQPAEVYREEAGAFIAKIETTLAASLWLDGKAASISDVALFPFVRQFAGVDAAWWREAYYPHTRIWLERWLESELFLAIMTKYPRWESGQNGEHFPFHALHTDTK